MVIADRPASPFGAPPAAETPAESYGISSMRVIEWQAALAYNVWDYQGKMLHFVGRAVDVMVTPSHDLWTTSASGSWQAKQTAVWEKKPAASRIGRTKTNFRHSAESWEGQSAPISIPPYVDNMGRTKTTAYEVEDLRAFARLCGWYVAEGYIGDEHRVSIAQSRHANPDHYAEIDLLLKYLSLKPSYVQDEKQIRFNHAGVSRFLKDNFGGHSAVKRIPTFVREWPADLQREFLDAYSRGDGHQYSHTGRSYKSKSQALIDGLQEMAAKVGLRCTSGATRLYPVGGTEYVGEATEFYINERVVTGTNAPMEVDYVGQVYCPTVPNGLVFVRRGGKVVISGNSRKDGKAYTTFADNDDVALFEICQEVLEGREGFEHVNFYIPNDELSACVDVAGVPIGFTHGRR